VLLAVVLAGCTTSGDGTLGGDPSSAPATPSGEPVPTAEAEEGTAPDDGEVQTARAALGEPVVALADALLVAAAEVDAVRHEVPRGAPARAAASALPERFEALRAAALDADEAGRGLGADEGRVGRAAALVTEAAAIALRAADAGAAQAAASERLAGIDERMDQAVAAWDAPGSQSGRRAALGEQAAALDALAADAAAEQPVPEGCPAQRDARVRWAGLLAERTRTLQSLATGETGDRYDAERAAFRADPFGEDRRAVDAADRPCWEQESVLARAAAGIRAEVEALEALLR